MCTCFNIGEVLWCVFVTGGTNKYILTPKSNGCVIFITPTQLVVTLKYSIRGRWESSSEKHLKDNGKTKEELVKTLSLPLLPKYADLLLTNVQSYAMTTSKNMSTFTTHPRNPVFTSTIRTTPQKHWRIRFQMGFHPNASHPIPKVINKVVETRFPSQQDVSVVYKSSHYLTLLIVFCFSISTASKCHLRVIALFLSSMVFSRARL